MRQKVLVTTFDKGLTILLAESYWTSYAVPKESIEVSISTAGVYTTLYFRGLKRPRYSPEDTKQVRELALSLLPREFSQALSDLPKEYLWNQVEFIMGRFLP